MCSDNERAVPRIHLHTVQRDTEWAAALSQLDDAPLGVVLASPSSCDPRRRPEAPVTESEVRLLAPRLGLAAGLTAVGVTTTVGGATTTVVAVTVKLDVPAAVGV